MILLSTVYSSLEAVQVIKHKVSWKLIFSDATHISTFEGIPPAATVFRDAKTIGYLFHSKQIAPIPAYSGKPMDMLVGIDLEGNIKGVQVLEHHEPILLVGIPESRLNEFVAQYTDKRVDDRIKVGAGKSKNYVNVDAITGATVTVMVMNEAILRSARAVAINKGIITNKYALSRPARVRNEFFIKQSWQQLVASGAMAHMELTRDKVDNAFKNTRAEYNDLTISDEVNNIFIDLFYTYLNAPSIGRNLLGESQYNWLMSELKEGEHAIALLANGVYSFKGSGYVRGGIFDRILIRQNEHEILFRDLDYYRLSDVYAETMPEFSEMAIFIIRKSNKFDPGSSWEIELLVKKQTGALTSVFSSFSSDYNIPKKYVELIKTELIVEDTPIWRQVWQDKMIEIIFLSMGLLILTAIMVLQDWLARFPRLLINLRNGFMLYTLFYIGWYLLGQLSIVNVFTFTYALTHDFKWDTFLIDPTMFILWGFVAASLLLWGRGVYCGWLCPFGALQKIVNQLARHFRVVQIELPQMIHDRLWGIKYLILMVLFAISLESLTTAERYAEIEPFKTSMTLHFNRELPFILYALSLVIVSVFNCKFYCKYICPLGAALAVPTKLSLVNWLRRRKECGSPCHICATECEIQAINDRGEIQLNECHYCLDCQVTYWDRYKCPPLVEHRKKREKAIKRNLKVNPDLIVKS